MIQIIERVVARSLTSVKATARPAPPPERARHPVKSMRSTELSDTSEQRVRARLVQSSLIGPGTPGATVERLASEARTLRFRKGALIWTAGQTPTSLTIVARGLVKVFRRKPDGEEVALGIFGPRDPIGLTAVLNAMAYPADAVALTARVELLALPVSSFRQAVADDAELVRALMRCTARNTHHLHAKIDILSHTSVSARIAALLLHLAERFGDETDDGAVCIPIELARRTIAELVGTRVETVIRIMSAWTRQGVLGNGDIGIVVYRMSELRDFAETQGR